MSSNNYYDVTEWGTGNPYNDIGDVINSIIADIKSRQTNTDVNEGVNPERLFIFRLAIIIFSLKWSLILAI